MSAKLYLITRADLTAGQQAAQLVHGMASFARDYPLTFSDWERGDNIVVCLTAKDGDHLRDLWEEANRISGRVEGSLAVSEFVEPDLGGELTCVVLEPAVEAFQELCSRLPLVGR